MQPDAFLRAPGLLSVGTPAAPAPAEVVASEVPARLLIGTRSWHPSNVVDLAFRVDDGPLQKVHCSPMSSAPGPQRFVGYLPALREGQRLDYRAELRRAGHLIEAFPEGAGWKTVTAGPAATLPPASPRQPPARPIEGAAGSPRFGHELDFLGALTVHLQAEVIGQTPQGFRINFLVKDGEARGPRLNGRIRPQGGDWMCIRPDGVGEVDIKITYETPDGALLLEQAGGVFNLGAEGYASVLRGIYTGSAPFFATPTYLTSHPDWQWINSLQCFGFGRVVMSALRVECDIYAPRLSSEPPLA